MHVRTGTHDSSAAHAWQALRSHLADPVSGVYGGMLRVAAADAILTADRRMALPAWLLEPFQVLHLGAPKLVALSRAPCLIAGSAMLVDSTGTELMYQAAALRWHISACIDPLPLCRYKTPAGAWLGHKMILQASCRC